MEYDIANLNEYYSNNQYPGRGIAIGMTADGTQMFYAYFIMGRSENSRNRILKRDGRTIRTEVFDPSKASDPSLIIYNAVREFEKKTIISNGDQTDTIYKYLSEDKTFEQALETRTFEPDSPNYTPRISGLIDMESLSYKLSILRAKDPQGKVCERAYYDYTLEKGLGHIIHTYEGDGDPLPSFTGAPRSFRVKEASITPILRILWEYLNEENRISIYLRITDIESGRTDSRILNKHH